MSKVPITRSVLEALKELDKTVTELAPNQEIVRRVRKFHRSVLEWAKSNIKTFTEFVRDTDPDQSPLKITLDERTVKGFVRAVFKIADATGFDPYELVLSDTEADPAEPVNGPPWLVKIVTQAPSWDAVSTDTLRTSRADFF